MEPEIVDLETFAAEVARELLALRRRLPDWFPPGPYADDRWPLDPLDRREAERLKRLGPFEQGALASFEQDTLAGTPLAPDALAQPPAILLVPGVLALARHALAGALAPAAALDRAQALQPLGLAPIERV
jgi:hypothetical protein